MESSPPSSPSEVNLVHIREDETEILSLLSDYYHNHRNHQVFKELCT